MAALLACAVAGCLQPPHSVTAKPTPQQGKAVPADPRQAEALERQGDLPGAAQEYARIARAAAAPLRVEHQLRAASLWLRGGEAARAKTMLAALEEAALDTAQATRQRLLKARIALAERQPEQALSVLQAPLPLHDARAQAEAELLLAEAYDMQGNYLDAARGRVAREALLSGAIAIEDNQRAILRSLGALSDNALQELRTSTDALGGWMELLFIARNVSAREAPRQISDWRKRYAGHPVRESVIAALFAQPPRALRAVDRAEDRQGRGQAPAVAPPQPSASVPSAQISAGYGTRIALLLPLSGPFAGAGGALRDAFLSAAHADAAGNTEVRVYDVGAEHNDPANPSTELRIGVLAAYQQAVQDGAQFIVGPLDKQGVKALLSLASMPVPTLALNYAESADGAPANNLYQFGLAPEDEARQAAERAWLEGRRQALLLVPQGEWGERMRHAFAARFEDLGGIVVDSQNYSPHGPDGPEFAGPVKRLLRFEETPKQKLLQDRKLPKATRRKDADMIFLAAQPGAARQLHPLLQFYYAEDLPVYATSHVYGGRPEPDKDQDLDGVLFGDMPWVLFETTPRQSLRAALLDQAPAAFAQYTRLYAMGVDAYYLLGQLERLRNFPDERFAGETGGLSLDAAGRIYRHLVWAHFVEGEARLLEVAPDVLPPVTLSPPWLAPEAPPAVTAPTQ